MPDTDRELERRLAAVERALEADPEADRLPSAERGEGDGLESRVAELESRVDELDAAVQAVRGFLGGVSAVNESIERRADAAVAAVDRMERRLDGRESCGVAEGGSGEDGLELPGEDNGTAVDEGSSADGECPDRGLRERLSDLR
jgi:hypothetical protein